MCSRTPTVSPCTTMPVRVGRAASTAAALRPASESGGGGGGSCRELGGRVGQVGGWGSTWGRDTEGMCDGVEGQVGRLYGSLNGADDDDTRL